jgi:hypothetical protein
LLNKVLVIGINPGVGRIRKNSAITRLYTWMDKLGYQRFSFTNVIHKTGMYNIKDIDYNMLMESAKGYTKILALGGFVSAALNRINIPHHTLPHPSPLNRKLNNSDYEREQLDFAMEYLNEKDSDHRIQC